MARPFPLASFLGLAFSISWGAVATVWIARGLQPLEQDADFADPLVLGMVLAMLSGPVIAALAAAAWSEGANGVRALVARSASWPRDWRWWAFAIATMPAVLLAVLAASSALDWTGTIRVSVAAGIGIGLLAGICEEFGWTGYATPVLLRRHSPLAAGLLLGVVHGVWHILPDAWGSLRLFGDLYWLHMLQWIMALTGLRVVMVWMFSRTQSLMLAQLMHASFTGSQVMLDPQPATVAQSLGWYGLFAAALVLVAIAVTAMERALPRRSRVG